MKLKELLADLPVTTVKSGGPLLEQEIQGVTKDSREVREGYVFFATGASKPYLSSALERKASAIVSDELLPGTFLAWWSRTTCACFLPGWLPSSTASPPGSCP